MKSATLSLTDFAALTARGSRIHHQRASLQVLQTSQNGQTPERRFVMEGPSGTHTLLVDATDLERLNAHWTVFCSDSRNQHPA